MRHFQIFLIEGQTVHLSATKAHAGPDVVSFLDQEDHPIAEFTYQNVVGWVEVPQETEH